MISVLRDQHVRDRMVDDLTTTLFVEAGAGTGKTTAVVSRVVALVLAGLEIDRLIAITFTEAAAAELRVRIRAELEQACHDEQLPVEIRDRARIAVASIDTAQIDTIHGFASTLLRTWPIEAGLPPAFTVLDDIEQQVTFRERLRDWLDGLEASSPAGRAVQRVLLLGLTPKSLLDATLGLEANHDLLRCDTIWPCPVPPDAMSIAHRAGPDLAGLRELLDLCRSPDVLHAEVVRLQFAAHRLIEAAGESSALVALQLLEAVKIGNKGNQSDWGSRGGENACSKIKEVIKEAVSSARECLTAHRTAALSGVLVELRDLVLESVAGRRRRGDATFHDLLAWARDLLRDHPDVRRAAQRRWDRVIVDEFQDTDPLQVELAFMLAADPEAPLPADWQQIRLVPGKLTLVGDPKQSIYRFRRADIAAYQEVERAIAVNGGETIHLTENFRSVARIIGIVNHHFSSTMSHRLDIQPSYVHLNAHHADSGSGVWRMGSRLDAAMPEVWQAEASATARAAHRVVAEGWLVHRRPDDEHADGPPTDAEPTDGARLTRPAQYRDICILIPTRTNLRRIERALQDEAVPYQVASGSLIVATQEVRDLLSCLRAIDDPSDQVALVAALRSPAFGVDDVELLHWSESGGALDHQSSRLGDGERIRSAFADLRALHDRRLEVPPAALVESLVTDRLLVAAAAAAPRPTEVWRRYRYVAARARAFAATGRTTLRAFLDWMEGLQRDQVRDVGGTSIDDENSVRIMTIHGAKGLEFPIVILTGLGSAGQFRPPSCLADRRSGTLDFRFGEFRTTRYESRAELERLMQEAESVRQMYVATTRARDHLVLCLFRGTRECHAGSFDRSAESFGEVPALSLEPPSAPATGGELARAAAIAAGRGVTAHPGTRGPGEERFGGQPGSLEADRLLEEPRSPEEDRLAEEAWARRRAGLIATHRALDVRSATGLAHDGTAAIAPDAPAPGEPPPAAAVDVATHRRGRAATSLGRAVHAVLQTIDLTTRDGVAELARAQAAVEGVAGQAAEVERLVLAACTSPPVQRAVQGRHWRELPVGVDIDGVLLEGFIDLMYEEPDGSLVVVDYKTDSLSPGEVDRRIHRYRPQGAAYALAIERVTGRPVSRVEFVLASAGITRTLPDLAAAVAEVRDRLRRPAGARGVPSARVNSR